MLWLPEGEKISKMFLFVLTWSTNVTDGQTDRQTHRHRMTAKSVSDDRGYFCFTFSLILLVTESRYANLYYNLRDKKLSCPREAVRCFMFVSSQLQHTYSAVFLLLVTAASDLLVHKILLKSVLLSPIVSGGVRLTPPLTNSLRS